MKFHKSLLCLLIVLMFFVSSPLYTKAQKHYDTTQALLQNQTIVNDIKVKPIESQLDTIKQSKVFQPNAKRAGLFSALVPGFGQIYNRQYWKAPIVYALMGTTTYMAVTKNTEYQRYRKAYIARLSNPNADDEFKNILTTTAIKQYQDEARQSADMMVVFTVIGYAGQIIEAISGAHLKNFDVSKDLSLKINPAIISPFNVPGISLIVFIKNKPMPTF